MFIHVPFVWLYCPEPAWKPTFVYVKLSVYLLLMCVEVVFACACDWMLLVSAATVSPFTEKRGMSLITRGWRWTYSPTSCNSSQRSPFSVQVQMPPSHLTHRGCTAYSNSVLLNVGGMLMVGQVVGILCFVSRNSLQWIWSNVSCKTVVLECVCMIYTDIHHSDLGPKWKNLLYSFTCGDEWN